MISTHFEFLMYVLGAAFYQQIQINRIRRLVFSVIEFYDDIIVVFSDEKLLFDISEHPKRLRAVHLQPDEGPSDRQPRPGAQHPRDHLQLQHQGREVRVRKGRLRKCRIQVGLFFRCYLIRQIGIFQSSGLQNNFQNEASVVE